MKLMNRLFFFILILIVVLSGGWWFYTSLAAKGLVLYKEKFVLPYIEQVMAEINTPEKKFKVYTALFTENDTIPKLANKEENSILWLGGYHFFVNEDMKKFGLILCSLPERAYILRDFLKLPAYYMPIGIAEDVSAVPSIKTTPQPQFALIGNPPYIKDIFKKRGLAYQQFSLTEAWSTTVDMSSFTAVFAEDTFLSAKSLDIPPLLIRAIEQRVPVVYSWKESSNWNPIYIFNDNAFSYVSEDDAAALISSVLQKDNAIKNKTDAMAALTETFFNPRQTVKRLLKIINTEEDDSLLVVPNTLNISLPTDVGNHAAGDYWIGMDLIEQFTAKGLFPLMTFRNSLYIPPTESIISIGGSIESSNNINLTKQEVFSVYYNQYPGTKDIINEKYFDDLVRISRNYDAFISASPLVVQQLRNRGVEVVYLPQFTNPRYFYPDYDEKLASDILFVGNYHFKRFAPLFALKHKLPITIYGDLWPDDIKVKAPYVDNRILRRYYSSAKIVLNDTTEVMRDAQVISNRIFDATASGAFVISDYISEIEAIYGDNVPMWKTEEEFVRLVTYYLDPAHEQERLEKAKKAQEITLQNFTVDKAAETLYQLLEKLKKEKTNNDEN